VREVITTQTALEAQLKQRIQQRAYSTPWRTRFHADGGQCSSVMPDAIPR